jgi:hypothetical protein
MLLTKFISGMLIVLGAGAALSQRSDNIEATDKCKFLEVFRKDGWTVPGVLGAKSNQRASVTNLPGVFLSQLEPVESETSLTEMLCKSNQTGRIEVNDHQPIKILQLWSFDFGGAPFAYRLEYEYEVIHDGKRSEIMSASVVWFYDLDGSGRFTSMRRAEIQGPSWLMPDFVPDWAKRPAEKDPAN